MTKKRETEVSELLRQKEIADVPKYHEVTRVNFAGSSDDIFQDMCDFFPKEKLTLNKIKTIVAVGDISKEHLTEEEIQIYEYFKAVHSIIENLNGKLFDELKILVVEKENTNDGESEYYLVTSRKTDGGKHNWGTKIKQRWWLRLLTTQNEHSNWNAAYEWQNYEDGAVEFKSWFLNRLCRSLTDAGHTLTKNIKSGYDLNSAFQNGKVSLSEYNLINRSTLDALFNGRISSLKNKITDSNSKLAKILHKFLSEFAIDNDQIEGREEIMVFSIKVED